MGQIGSTILRPFRNFNIENRAARAIDEMQNVAKPAPKHPSTVKQLARFREEHPEFLEAQNKRDEKLHEHLKQMYVQSTIWRVQTHTSQKPLPADRMSSPDTDLGVMDPVQPVREGRASLRTIIGFLGQHETDKANVTASKIAHEYKLDEEEIKNVLAYFKVLTLHIPEEMYQQNKKLKSIVEQMKLSNTNSPIRFEKPKQLINNEPQSSNTDISHSKNVT